jgi:hypothetical protein
MDSKATIRNILYFANKKSMKKNTLFLVLFCVSSVGFSQNLAKDTTEIKNVIADFFELFVQDDIAYFEKNCTPDFELYEVGKVWNADTLRNLISKRQAQKRIWVRTNEFRYIKFNVKKDVAWVSYFNTAYLTNATTSEKRIVRWLESVVLVRQNRKWLLAQMHSTSIK